MQFIKQIQLDDYSTYLFQKTIGTHFQMKIDQNTY